MESSAIGSHLAPDEEPCSGLRLEPFTQSEGLNLQPFSDALERIASDRKSLAHDHWPLAALAADDKFTVTPIDSWQMVVDDVCRAFGSQFVAPGSAERFIFDDASISGPTALAYFDPAKSGTVPLPSLAVPAGATGTVGMIRQAHLTSPEIARLLLELRVVLEAEGSATILSGAFAEPIELPHDGPCVTLCLSGTASIQTLDGRRMTLSAGEAFADNTPQLLESLASDVDEPCLIALFHLATAASHGLSRSIEIFGIMDPLARADIPHDPFTDTNWYGQEPRSALATIADCGLHLLNTVGDETIVPWWRATLSASTAPLRSVTASDLWGPTRRYKSRAAGTGATVFREGSQVDSPLVEIVCAGLHLAAVGHLRGLIHHVVSGKPFSGSDIEQCPTRKSDCVRSAITDLMDAGLIDLAD